MPASELREGSDVAAPGPGVASLDRLEAAVGRLLEELQTARLQARRAGEECEKLRGALKRTGAGPTGEELQERLEALAEENRRLRERLAEARERAQRIRSRLMVVEDEL